MSLFVISDLHLSIGEGINKPMEVFGARWTDYTQKLERNWRAVMTDSDDIVIAGDISWALKLEQALPDLKFIDSLPGTKYIGKGNHDFWWSTASKMHKLFEDNDIKTIKLLYNNAYSLSDFIICGTRGWFTDKLHQNVVGEVDYDKIVNREVLRLKLSLDEAVRLKADGDPREMLVFLHFPPVWGDFVCPEIVALLHEYGIKKCFFGHIHGAYNVPRSFEYEGINMVITSADYLNFAAMPIFPDF